MRTVDPDGHQLPEGMAHTARVFVQVLPDFTPTQEAPTREKLGAHIPLGYLFVVKHTVPGAHYKLLTLDGGTREHPSRTAMRALAKQASITLGPDRFAFMGKEYVNKSPCWKCLFRVQIEESQLQWARSQDSTLETKYFPIEEFYAAVREGRFLQRHFKQLGQFTAILPLGRDVAPVVS